MGWSTPGRWSWLVLALIALFVTSRRRRRARAPSQAAALGAYLDLTDVLGPRGHPLVEHATPREYLRGVSADPAMQRAVVDEAEVVVATLERDRFSGRPAPDADLERARAAVATVRRARVAALRPGSGGPNGPEDGWSLPGNMSA